MKYRVTLKQLSNVEYAKCQEKHAEVGFNHINGIAVPELRVHVYTPRAG